MVLRSMPASRKRKLSVPSTSKSGKPAAKPSASMRKLAGCKYRRSASRQVRTVAGGALSVGAAERAGSDICGLSTAARSAAVPAVAGDICSRIARRQGGKNPLHSL